MQHEETDVKTNKHSVLGCLIAAVCRNGPSHGQGGSRLHLRWPNWLLPRPYGLLIPPDLGSSPLFRACPAGSWEQLSFPRVLINPAPPCISYNKQSKLNRLVYEDSRQLGCPIPHRGRWYRLALPPGLPVRHRVSMRRASKHGKLDFLPQNKMSTEFWC